MRIKPKASDRRIAAHQLDAEQRSQDQLDRRIARAEASEGSDSAPKRAPRTAPETKVDGADASTKS